MFCCSLRLSGESSWERNLCSYPSVEGYCTAEVEYGSPLNSNREGESITTYVESDSFSSCFYFISLPRIFLLSRSLSIDNATGKINTVKRKKREGIFLACYYMSCVRKTVFVGKTEMPRCWWEKDWVGEIQKEWKTENDGGGLCKGESNGDGSNEGGDKMG